MQFLLRHIETIIAAYGGHPPLSLFLKQYYRQHARLGSRDRKAITEAVYTYYRCAAFCKDEILSPAAIIAQGMDWCGSDNPFLRQIMAGADRSGLLPDWSAAGITAALSYDLDREEWLQSMLSQPDLFIRIRQNKAKVLDQLRQRQVPFRLTALPVLGESCVALPNGTKVDELLDEQDYVIQDRSSQASLQVALSYIGTDRLNNRKIRAWDVCSGAGGKTLLLKDMLPSIHLLATDVRERILHNLRVRLRRAGLGGVETISMNVADKHEFAHKMPHEGFDFIVCDVPCTGSGTWARTPEQFYFFDESGMANFSALQFAIAAHATEKLNSGGILCYITCSVFLAENEQVVDRLVQQKGLLQKHRQIINGIPHKADCMYIAVLEKP